MSDGVFNIAKGRVAEFANRVVTNDPAGSQLVAVLAEGAANDETIKDFDTLAALLADAGVTEASFVGYTRKDIDSPSIGVDDGGDTMDADIPDQTWSSAQAGNTLTRLFICYDPTGSSADSAIIPLTYHDFNVVTDGTDVVAEINTQGFFSAA